MGLIKIDDKQAIVIIGSQGQGDDTICMTIAENNITQKMITMDANKTAVLIRELRAAFLSISG